jgi:hypothetical protein
VAIVGCIVAPAAASPDSAALVESVPSLPVPVHATAMAAAVAAADPVKNQEIQEI